jgi:hypothetical protein
MSNFTTLKTSELVAYYNAHVLQFESEKPVTKFRDRVTAISRCEALAARIAAEIRKANAKAKTTVSVGAKPFEVEPNPAGDFHAVREGSKVAQFIDLLFAKGGASPEALRSLLSPKASIIGILRFDVRQLVGYGYRFDGKRYFGVLPKGMTAPTPHRPRVEKKAA